MSCSDAQIACVMETNVTNLHSPADFLFYNKQPMPHIKSTSTVYSLIFINYIYIMYCSVHSLRLNSVSYTHTTFL